MKTYLVTGGAGFIGSHLCEKLLKEHRVIMIDNLDDYYDVAIKEEHIAILKENRNFEFYKCDIRDREKIVEIFNQYPINGVVHLAGLAGVRPSLVDPILYEDVNIKGTMILLEEMKTHNMKNIVIASSSSVYGNCKTLPFTEEESCNRVISPYAATKKANETIASVYHSVYGMNMILARFFTVYGERQRPDLAISKFTRAILNNKPITVYGDGNTFRDYTYVHDIVQGIEKSIRYLEQHDNTYEIVNIGSATPLTLNQLIETIENVTGKKAIIQKMPMQPGDVDGTYASIEKAKKLLGYSPTISIEEGITRFVKWYQDKMSCEQ